MRVDLPAPFSPTRQWISRGATEKVTSLRAFTPGKVFVMFFIERMGVLMMAPRGENRKTAGSSPAVSDS